jgi:hypothetical protein
VEVDSSPRRRRSQFRLRTLLAFVTLFAVVCGYVARQAEIVRARRSVFGFAPNSLLFKNPQNYICFSPEPGGVPWIRQIFGDRLVFEIALPIGTDKAERQRLAALFPEAVIRAYHPPYFMTGSHFGGEFFPFPDEDSKSTPETH